MVALDKAGNDVQERKREDTESQPAYMTVVPERAAKARTRRDRNERIWSQMS